jgi:hypothetical protein
MSRPQFTLCQFCKQDLIRNCEPRPGQPCLMTGIAKLAQMGEQVGLSVQQMIDLLNDDLSLNDLLNSITCAAALVATSDASHAA